MRSKGMEKFGLFSFMSLAAYSLDHRIVKVSLELPVFSRSQASKRKSRDYFFRLHRDTLILYWHQLTKMLIDTPTIVRI